jgi:hypothetical protein
MSPSCLRVSRDIPLLPEEGSLSAAAGVVGASISPSRRTTAAMQRGGTDGVPAQQAGWWE